MRPRLRPYGNALVLNVILALGLIGFPWWRGRTRAEMSAHAYVEYAACLHGGQVADVPGLALPEHHRERFAALYVHAVPEWPASCRDALDRIPQEETFLLFPGAKTGEEEVRAAVIGARAALDDLAEARAAEHPRQIPHRLLRTLDHLAAAMSVLIEETGLPLATQHLAFDLGEGPSLVRASRVPLQTAAGGPLFVAARANGLRVVTGDARSVAEIVVHDGTVDITQIRRPSAARGLLDDGEHAYLAWVTGDATCAHDEAHCARRLTGLARVREGLSDPQAEVWLAAHPAFSIARSFAFDGPDVGVLAREVDGTVTHRSFHLPDPWPETAAPTPAVPLTASMTIGLGRVHDAFVRDDTPIGATDDVVLVSCGQRALSIEPTRVRSTSATYPIPGDTVITDGAGPITATFGAEIAPPIRGVDPLEDHARCAVTEQASSFAWIDRQGRLRLVADVDAPDDQVVADHIAGFAMTRTGDTVILATWGQDGEREITLRRIWHGRTLSSEIAAACWDDGVGLCGPAGLATEGSETILYAREGTDLWVLRVTGAGVAPLPGLE